MYRPRILDRFLRDEINITQEGILDDVIENKQLTSVLYDMANVICKSKMPDFLFISNCSSNMYIIL